MKIESLLTVQNSLILALVLSHTNPFQVIPSYFFKIHFNNIIQYMPKGAGIAQSV
jgi:hypothetical protein